MADQIRTTRSTAIKTAAPATLNYQGHATSNSASTVKARDHRRVMQQAKQRLDEDQRSMDKALAREHNEDILTTRLQHQIQSAGLKKEAAVETGELKLEQQHEKDSFTLESDWALQLTKLEVSRVQTKGQLDSAKLSFISNSLQSILSFGGKYAQAWGMEQEAKQVQRDQLSALYNGSTPDQFARDVEIEKEVIRNQQTAKQAIDKVGGNDLLLKDSLLEPQAKAMSEGAKRQMTGLNFAAGLGAAHSDYVSNNLGGITTMEGLARVSREGIYKEVVSFVAQGGVLDRRTIAAISKAAQSSHQQRMGQFGPQIIKLKREERTREFTNLAKSRMDAGMSVSEVTQRLSNDLNGSLLGSRAANNKLAVQKMVTLLKNAEDIEGLEELYNTRLVVNDTHPEGQPGTEVSVHYGDLVKSALIDLDIKSEKLEGIKIKEIEVGMYQQLANDNLTQEEREAIVLKAAEDMKGVGGIGLRAGRELEGKIVDLKLPGQFKLNEDNLLNDILTGDVTTEQEITNQKLQGRITAAAHTRLIAKLKNENSSKSSNNESVRGIATGQYNKFEGALLDKTGLKKNTDGTVVKAITGETPVAAWQLEPVLAQAKLDLNRVGNELVEADPSLLKPENQFKLNAALTAAYKQWWDDNVFNEGGRYAVLGQLIRDPEVTSGFWSPELKSGLQSLTDSTTNVPVNLNYVDVLQPQDFSSHFGGEGKQGPSIVKENFKFWRYDKAFTTEEFTAISEEFTEKGTFSPLVINRAKALGKSPSLLLEHQARALGLPMPQYIPPAPPAVEIPQKSQEVSQILQRDYSLPTKGADWLSGNIDGNIESQPQTIAEVTAKMDAISQNPDVQKVFYNPYSTDRQLMQASETLIAESGPLTNWEKNYIIKTFKNDRDAGRPLNHYYKFYPNLLGSPKAPLV